MPNISVFELEFNPELIISKHIWYDQTVWWRLRISNVPLSTICENKIIANFENGRHSKVFLPIFSICQVHRQLALVDMLMFSGINNIIRIVIITLVRLFKASILNFKMAGGDQCDFPNMSAIHIGGYTYGFRFKKSN